MTRIRIRRASARGRTERDWLHCAHSFSFGHYYDPSQTGYGPLLAINEHYLRPGAGFAPRACRAVDLLSYVIDGSLRYRDAQQNACTLGPGMLQLVQTGAGLTLSEMNACQRTPLHLLQIWLAAAPVSDQAPRYCYYTPPAAATQEGFVTVASGDPDAALPLSGDIRVSLARPAAGSELPLALSSDRQYYLQLARGRVQCGNVDPLLESGDGVHLCRAQTPVLLHAVLDSELLLIDLPADT